MKFKLLTISFILSMILSSCKNNTDNKYLLIRGGTIIDTELNSGAANDILNGYILINNGTIEQWGEWSDSLNLPSDYNIL